MSATVAQAPRKAKVSIVIRVIAWLVPIAGWLLAGWAWAWSSPIGSAPDDDYHMTSIWCPTPLEESGCVVGYDGDSPIVQVPSLVSAGVCWVFDADKSASCQDQIGGVVNTMRVDNGGYPGGYYDFMHLLVGPDVEQSVYSMRLFNAGLATLLIATTVAVTPKSARLPLVGGLIISSVPLGLFLMASLNPSSWAITGVTVAWASTHALITGEGRVRRVLATILLLVGAVLAATSRSDSAAFIVVVTAGYLILQFRREIPWTTVAAVFLASAIGVMGFLSGRQSDGLTHSWGGSDTGPQGLSLLLLNLRELPSLFSGMFGGAPGLGWLDTRMPGITFVTMMVVIGGAVFLGTQRLSLRKALVLLMLLCGASGLALMTLQINGVLVGEQVQPRYLLPLMMVFVMTLFVDARRPERSVTLALPTRWILWAFVVVANCFALQRNIRRYTTGMDVDGFNLDLAVEWWAASVSPMTLWTLGSLGFALFAAAILYVGPALDRGEVMTLKRSFEN